MGSHLCNRCIKWFKLPLLTYLCFFKTNWMLKTFLYLRNTWLQIVGKLNAFETRYFRMDLSLAIFYYKTFQKIFFSLFKRSAEVHNLIFYVICKVS